MEALLEQQKLFLFIVLVFPGLVSMVVYRLLLPAAPIEWTSGLIQGLFYSIGNFAICSPVLVIFDLLRASHPIIASLLVPLVLLVGPILWPVVLVWLLQADWVARRLQLPFPTGWDFFFHQRVPCFVLITLKDGRKIGGFFDPRSYAGSFPNHGDIYVRHVYKVDVNGEFAGPVKGSLGFWIRKDEYSLIEFFEVPI